MESDKLALVAPSMTAPFLRQTKVNGPVPCATVAKATASPAHAVAFINGVAVVNSLTSSVALFVTVLHAPVTSTA